MAEQLRILNIGGHPKDCILYAGGTIAKHVQRGDHVTILNPYTGMSHHLTGINEYRETGKMPDIDALVEDRKQELINASAVLGVTDVRFLGYDDTITTIKPEIVSDIADVIGEIAPHVVITHWPHDTVGAHALSTQMLLIATDTAAGIRAGKSYSPTGGDTGGWTAQIFYHDQRGRTNVLESLNPRMPDTIIDITDVVKLKAEAMNKFTSQHYSDDGSLQRKLGEALDGGIAALHMRVPYAEGFLRHNPELHEYLPVSEYGMKITRETTKEFVSQMLL
jgi:LmbE family N-acetylglucosaminyl deacetylase